MKSARGLVCGVFSPPHAGHQLVVDFARQLVGEVTIVLIVTPDDLIGAELRQSWLSEMFPSNSVVQCTVDEPEFDAAKLAAALPEGASFDVVFGSDTFDAELAKALSAQYVAVDPERANIGVSGSAIRDDVLGNWEFLPACVRPQYVQRICVFGPTGSGKSSLVEQLAIHYDTVGTFEYRESFITQAGREPNLDEMALVAAAQLASEDAMARQANRVLFCDSNASALALEAEIRHNQSSSETWALARERHYTLHLLMDVDGEWAMGMGRKPTAKAAQQFERYRQFLIESDLKYLRLDGDYDTRFRIACDAVDNITGQPTGRPPRPEYLRSA